MQKIYAGKGKKMKESWLKVTVNPDVIAEHIKEFKGAKFVKLDININPEPDKYGKDVSISIDTWEPTQEKGEEPATRTEDSNAKDIADVPFG